MERGGTSLLDDEFVQTDDPSRVCASRIRRQGGHGRYHGAPGGNVPPASNPGVFSGEVRERIVQKDIEEPIRFVACMDITFDKQNESRGYVAMGVWDLQLPHLEPLLTLTMPIYTEVPYKAGFLAFREAPACMHLLNIAKEHYPIDTVMFDGNGVWHPRGCGIASHFGVLANIRTLGVSKNVLVVEDVNKNTVLEHIADLPMGECRTIITSSGVILGAAYNHTGVSKNSVFISVGHRISLESACALVQRTSTHKNNELIRHVDLLTRKMRG